MFERRESKNIFCPPLSLADIFSQMKKATSGGSTPIVYTLLLKSTFILYVMENIGINWLLLVYKRDNGIWNTNLVYSLYNSDHGLKSIECKRVRKQRKNPHFDTKDITVIHSQLLPHFHRSSPCEYDKTSMWYHKKKVVKKLTRWTSSP